jgi:hypothetical protein
VTKRRTGIVSRAAERAGSYEPATTRFNLVIPKSVKQAIDEEADKRGVSPPELARRLLEAGLDRLREEEFWEHARKVAPLYEERNRAIVEKWDAWERAWGEAERGPARRRR